MNNDFRSSETLKISEILGLSVCVILSAWNQEYMKSSKFQNFNQNHEQKYKEIWKLYPGVIFLVFLASVASRKRSGQHVPREGLCVERKGL